MIDEEEHTPEELALMRYQSMRRLLLFFAILIIGGLMMTVAPAWENPSIPSMIRIMAMGTIWIGIVGRMWCTLYIGGRKADEVVTEGPYSVMRNPLYFYSAIAAIGVGSMTATLTAGLLFGLLCWFAFHFVILREEKFLSDLFGAPYAAYCAAVPRFFPNPALFKDPGELTIDTGRLYRTLIDGLVFFLAIPAFFLAEYLQQTGVIPVLFSWY